MDRGWISIAGISSSVNFTPMAGKDSCLVKLGDACDDGKSKAWCKNSYSQVMLIVEAVIMR